MPFLRMISDHWRGAFGPRIACGVIGLGVGLLVLVVLKILAPAIVASAVVPLALAIAVAALAVGVLWVWQAVGAIRSLKRHDNGMAATTNRWIATAAFGIYGFVVLLSLADLTRAGMNWSALRSLDNERPRTTVRYMNADGVGELHVSGELHFGLRADLDSLLAKHPDVRTLVLDSPGGVVSEARGLHAFVDDQSLVTRVDARCFSACVLVYAGGNRRLASPRARFGFHRYALRGHYWPPGTDIDAEHARDKRILITAGVSADFLSGAYNAPHDAMWIPALDVLVSAGLVHEIVSATPSPVATRFLASITPHGETP